MSINKGENKDALYIYNSILISHLKNEILPFWDNMEWSSGYSAKWNKSDKDKYHLFSYAESKKHSKQTNRLIDTENKWAVAKRKEVRGWGNKERGLRGVNLQLHNK